MSSFAIYCLKKTNKIKLIYIIGIILFAVGCILGLFTGSSDVTAGEILSAITQGNTDSSAFKIFLYVRLIRVAASLICGAALAVSGAVIQSVLCNNLASPGIVGVNAGAGLAIVLCTAAGIYGGWQMSLGAFLGAFLTVMAVGAGARAWGSSRGTVILIGVALNSFLGAVSDSVITLSPEVGVMSNNFKIGEFSAVTYTQLIPLTVIVAFSLVILFTLSNYLEVITLSDDKARALGMNTPAVRAMFLTIAALRAGGAVSVCGLLSFVGLIVPNIVRRFAEGSAKHIIALSAIFGAGFVCICDTAARVIFSPFEIPVGIIMAFIGAPFFVFILIKGKGGSEHA